MKVLKFGGTSVGSAENINKVISILEQQSKSSQIAVVVSAVGGITDKLLEAANLACDKELEYKHVYNTIWSRHNKVIEGLFANSENDKSLQKNHEKSSIPQHHTRPVYSSLQYAFLFEGTGAPKQFDNQ